nr:ABC transporter permease [uncultured Merdimonas sp.]
MKKKRKKDIGTLFTVPMIISIVIIAVIIFASVLAPIIGSYDPDALNLGQALLGASPEHWFGTDQVGRDIFTRLMYGARTTLLSALLVVVISIIVGIPLGVLCGYYGGKLDNIIMRVEDVILAFPALLLAFLLVASFGKGIANAIIALGIVYVPMLSRLTRSLTMVEKNKTYVEAARSIGFSDVRIIFRHILPNCVPTLIAQLTLDIGYAILDLAAMSFLGLGVQPPTSDWGAMLEEGRQYIQTNPELVLAPGLAIIITVVAFNVLSDNIQMYLDPTQRKLPPFKKLKKMAGGLVEE